MRDLWTRLYDVTNHMASRLADPEARFHGTLVSNVSDLVELLPRLNIVGDPHLASLTEQVRKQLCQHSADLLRNSPTTRLETAASAAAIARTIAGVLAIDQTPRSCRRPTLQARRRFSKLPPAPRSPSRTRPPRFWTTWPLTWAFQPDQNTRSPECQTK